MWAALKSSSNRTSITIGGSVDSSCFRSSAVWISAFITRYDELLMIAQLPAFAPSISGTHVDRTACCESKPVQGALYNMHRSRTRDRVDPGACLGQWRREGPACLSETAEPVDAPSPFLVLRKLPGSNLLRPYSGLTGSNSRAVRWSRRDTPYLPVCGGLGEIRPTSGGPGLAVWPGLPDRQQRCPKVLPVADLWFVMGRIRPVAEW